MVTTTRSLVTLGKERPILSMRERCVSSSTAAKKKDIASSGVAAIV